MRTLLPLPLSQRQCNLNDIFQELRDIDEQLEYGEYDISHTRSVIEDMNEKLDKYIHTYAKDGEWRMIKVGQIYKQRDYNTFVVTYINNSKLVYMIYIDGSMRLDFTDSLLIFIKDYCEFIA